MGWTWTILRSLHVFTTLHSFRNYFYSEHSRATETAEASWEIIFGCYIVNDTYQYCVVTDYELGFVSCLQWGLAIYIVNQYSGVSSEL